MKKLLTITAILEALTGIALVIAPIHVVQLLLSSPLSENGGIIIAMIGGAAILSLAFTCWIFRNNTHSMGIVNLLLFYNSAVLAIATYGMINYSLSAFGLWVVVGFHSMMSTWCIVVLAKQLKS